jgi:hypothetical protein
MSVFEYVSVMVGVVLALAVSHILTFIATVIANPERAKKYWLHFLWVFLIFALNVNAWLLLWTTHGQSEFPIWQLLTMLFTASLIFVASRILVPELSPGNTVDLRAHLVQVRIPFFSTLSLVCLLPVLRGLLVEGGSPLDPLNVLRELMFLCALSGLFVKRPVWLVWLAALWGTPLVGGLLLFWDSLK